MNIDTGEIISGRDFALRVQQGMRPDEWVEIRGPAKEKMARTLTGEHRARAAEPVYAPSRGPLAELRAAALKRRERVKRQKRLAAVSKRRNRR